MSKHTKGPDEAVRTVRATTTLMGVALAGMVILSLSLVEGARGVDAMARQSEEAVLAVGWAARLKELEAYVVPQTNWDDAVAKLDNEFDPSWARSNIAAFLTQTSGFELVSVLDPSGAAIFGSAAGGVLRAGQMRALATAAEPLTTAVRRKEASRGRFVVSGPSARMISKPIQAGAVAMIEGRPFVVVATLVQPDFGAATPKGDRAPIVLVAKAIDAQFLAPLVDRYDLKAARFDGPGRAAPSDRAAILVNDAHGTPVLSLTWRPRQPGAALLHRIAGGTLAVMALLMAALLIVYLSARRAAEALIDSRNQLARALQAAEAADVRKSEFLASMSHEIRTPLNGVLGALRLIVDEPLSGQGRILLENGLASGEMVSELINDILDYSRIEAGRLDLAPTPTDVHLLIRSVVDQFEAPCSQKGIWLKCEIAADVCWADLDPLRLRQCLFNLIGNAVKFTSVGGIWIEAGLETGPQGVVLCVSVSDTGVGIPDDAQTKIFERFRQVDGTTTRTHGGSGLGLAITRHLAEMMGGSVRLSSTVGEGSTFRLEVQARPASRPAVAPPAPGGSDAPLGGAKVLIVDDNATNLLIAETLLARLGAEVTTAQSGAEALEAAQQAKFDLILMDIQMPVMDGLETTRRLREQGGAGAEVPIIALTANVHGDQKVRYLEAGMSAVVGKPIAPSQLLAEIVRISAAG